MNRKTVVLILLIHSLVTSLILIGCGVLDDNSQPSIEPITDQTLYIGDKTTVEVNVTDADVDDTHIINASSDNTNVATVSVDDTSLTITSKAVGQTMITVSATDDSSHDNADATPLIFLVTINEYINKGLCSVGMTLQPGQSCTYFADREPVIFYVNGNNEGCRESELSYTTEIFGLPVVVTFDFLCADEDIKGDEIYIRGADNPLDPNFHASKNRDGSWTIDKVP